MSRKSTRSTTGPRVLAAVWMIFACQVAVGAVNQSAREIPLAYEVDVCVVGGSTGAVAAAITAAEQGAEVFLLAPYPYLGDDMTATLRLWLEPGEEPSDPLAEAIFNDPLQPESLIAARGLPFTYKADRESAAMHRDTNPPSRLTDGRCSSASSESVQFDGDVTITCDLQSPREIAEVHLLSFFRAAAAERPQLFKTDAMTVSTSLDGETWQVWGTVVRKDAVAEDAVTRLSLPVATIARYVRCEVKKAEDVDRILLGELLILPPRDAEEASAPAVAPRPLHVKKALDDALLAAGVKYLYATYPTDVLRDADGNLCGIVMTNRAGRQAVVAKTIIDATPRADVARMAGAAFRPWPVGKQTLGYVVIGGQPATAPGLTAEVKGEYRGPWPNAAQTSSGQFDIISYTFETDMPDASWREWSEASNYIREITYSDEQQFTSDQLFQVPADAMIGRTTSDEAWHTVDSLPLEAFVPKDVSHLLVLGPCADVSRDAASALSRPLHLIAMGRRVGQAAASGAAARGQAISSPRVAGPSPVARPVSSGEVGEVLIGVRPTQELPTVPCPAQSLPVLGTYDVVVVGGGTCGAPAGIAAARAGAKTLVVEYLHSLGGVGTAGAISSYYWGNRVGFTASVPGAGRWVIEQRMRFWRSELLQAGGDLWCGVLGCGALVDGTNVQGVVIATPEGRGVILAKVVIDATGNCDIAYPAGADCMYTDETELAVQGTGLSPRNLGASYANTDFTIVDETDAVDTWHVFVYAKDKYRQAFDQAKLIDTRERRRVVGPFIMTLLDQINQRTYPDTITVAYSNFDTHGYTVDPYLELEHPEKVGHYVGIPYRCCLPIELDGILVGGLGISTHRDAVPLIRMQADMQNLGYALGLAAAMAAEQGIPPREVDVKSLQRELVAMRIVPESVLTDRDSHDVTDAQLADAIAMLPHDFTGVHVVMWAHREKAHAAVRAALASATDDDSLDAYAQVLAVMGDPIGVDRIIDKVQAYDAWDEGWNYVGMGQFGSALSPLDRLILALGRAGDPKAIPVIVEKLRLLTAKDAFSHHRACALALEFLAHREAAPALAEHLMKPGITGFVHDTLEKARQADAASPGGTNAVQTRRDSLIELGTARALYRCGDYGGLGEKILREYVDDLRGHWSRHAKAVLEKSEPPKVAPPATETY